MYVKKFLPCIYLKNGSAVASDEDDSIIEADAYSLAMKFCRDLADGIIIYDLSEGMGDEAHDEALRIIRAICGDSEVPIYATGNIKRLEDVKKLIYAGCSKTVQVKVNKNKVKITAKTKKVKKSAKKLKIKYQLHVYKALTFILIKKKLSLQQE